MLLVALALAIAVFAPTLTDWFNGDDFWFLRASQKDSIGDYAAKAIDFRNTGTATEFDRYRPLYPIAWRLQFEVFGLHAFYYHAVVLLTHLACIVLVWLIARRLFAETWAANVAAIVFAVHPAYADAVAWIASNRPFATLPFLLSLWLFMRSVDEDRRNSLTYCGAAVLSYIVALLMHSSTILLPAVLAAYVVLVVTPQRPSLGRSVWLKIIPFVAAAAASASIQWWVRQHLAIDEAFQFGMHQWLNYGQFLGLSLVPVNTTDIDFAAAPNIQLAASLAMLVLFAWVIRLRRRPDVGAFTIAWFLLVLLPDSTLILGASARMLYLAGPPLAIFLVYAAIALHNELPMTWQRVVLRVAPAVFVVGIAVTLPVTYHRTLGTRDDAADDQRFAQALRAADLQLAPGATLYVSGAPPDLATVTGTHLAALVQLYYGEVQVRQVDVAVEPALAPGDAMFRYEP